MLNLGIIGGGEIVRTIHLPVLRQIPEVSIAWVMDTDAGKASRLATQFRIPRSFTTLNDCPDVDAVLIAIPVGVRRDAWTRAFERGWHVLCEKPIAGSTGEFDWVNENMRGRGKVISPGLMRRFYASTQLMQDLLQDRVFGEPIEVWAAEGGRMTRTGRGADWYQLDRGLAGGGVLIETGSHLLDQVVFMTHARDVRVENYIQHPPGRTMEFEAKVEGRLSIPMAGEVPLTCLLSRANDVCNGIFVRFPRLVLRMDHGPDGKVRICDMRNIVTTTLAARQCGAHNSFQAFHEEWQSFLRRCRNGGMPNGDSDTQITRLSVKAIEDCYARL